MMPSSNDERSDKPTSKKKNTGFITALVATGIVLVLTWAIATLFEVALAKALALVILFLFVVIIALFMVGVA